VIVYFDTSALVATYVEQTCSSQARAAKGAARIATSMLTYAETLGALETLIRRRSLSRRTGAKIETEFLAEWSHIQRVRLDERLLPDVRRMVKFHSLRGADAIQLASACLVARGCGTAGVECQFACDDRDLTRAATAEGLQLAW
jgi:predicted nucleic acid-binding protein